MHTETVDLIVVGGGPGGSTAAAIAARGGARVLLLEAGAHPRPQVGESMLPGIIPILEEMGCLAQVQAANFEEKTGASYWGFGAKPWDLWFRETEAFDSAWMVDRPRFDQILFDAAARAGATTLQNAPMAEAVESQGRVTGVSYRVAGELRHASARFVIDASGATAVVARSRTQRTVIKGLRHRAHYAHFESAGRRAPPYDKQAFFVGIEDAWIWCFPLGPNLLSVGVVQLETTTPSPFDFEETIMDSAVGDILGQGSRRITQVWRARDWSYEVDQVAGPGWFAVGDAAGFIDPILSTGVMLAMHSGWHAARTVVRALGGADEAKERDQYAAHHRELFHDMLRTVRFFYQHNTDHDTLFWKSKQALMKALPLQPRKAFLVLTSGLVKNLAFEQAKEQRAEQRTQLLNENEDIGTMDSERSRDSLPRGEDSERSEPRPGIGKDLIGTHDPEQLTFICVHLEHQVQPPVSLYFLIEIKDPSGPSLFRTQHFDLNCLAPPYDNDPISVPALAGPLRQLHTDIDALDAEPISGDAAGLATWWRAHRGDVRDALAKLPAHLRVIRVFGE